MRKFRFIYIASIAILIGLLGLIIYLVPQRARLLEIEREQLSRLEDRWVLDFDIVNRDTVDHDYVIIVRGTKQDELRAPLEVLVRAGQRFTSTTHIFPENLSGSELTLEVYKKGQAEPIQVSRYVLSDRDLRQR